MCGRDLIDLCKSANVRFSNRRVVGDLFGEFTVVKARGKSVVNCSIVYYRLTIYEKHCTRESRKIR